MITLLTMAQSDMPVSLGLPTAVALLALSLLCGILSLIVVWRRWAFLGEGIAHAGFGGAGTAWLLACFFPVLDKSVFVTLCVVVFCLLSGMVIGMLHQKQRVQADTAIGAWMVGSLAWGFVGQQVYFSTFRKIPAGFEALLFGQTQTLSWSHAQLALSLAAFCLVILVAFRREILLLCLDPTLAQVEGLSASVYHYLLIGVMALTITLGVRLVGSVLITALLILPGATAMLVTRRLATSVLLAGGLGLAGAGIGIGMNHRWHMLPQGPMIVLSLFGVFLITWRVCRNRCA